MERVVGRLLRRRKLIDTALRRPMVKMSEVALCLLIEPTLGGSAKGYGKTDRHLGADSGTAVQNGGKGLAAHTQRFRSLRNGDAKGFKTKSLDDLPRMRWIVHAHRLLPQW